MMKKLKIIVYLQLFMHEIQKQYYFGGKSPLSQHGAFAESWTL